MNCMPYIGHSQNECRMVPSSQSSLFDDTEHEYRDDPILTSTGTLLHINTGSSAKLTSTQRTFNMRMKQLHALEEELPRVREKTARWRARWAESMPALALASAQQRIALARALEASTHRFKYTERQRNMVGEVIIDLLDIAFDAAPPDEELLHLYEQELGMGESDAAEIRQTPQNAQAELLKAMFGITIDPAELDGSPESGKRIEAALYEHFNAQMGGMWGDVSGDVGPQGRSQTPPKLSAAEQRRRAQESVRLRSLRAVYMSLVKTLHPDTCREEEERLRREELMKRVTVAYEAKDIGLLLRLELEYVQGTVSSADRLADSTLKAYNALLKEQVAALQRAIRDEYEAMEGFTPSKVEGDHDAQFERYLRGCEAEERSVCDVLSLFLSTIGRATSKKEVLSFVQGYLDDMENDNVAYYYNIVASSHGNTSAGRSGRR